MSTVSWLWISAPVRPEGSGKPNAFCRNHNTLPIRTFVWTMTPTKICKNNRNLTAFSALKFKIKWTHWFRAEPLVNKTLEDKGFDLSKVEYIYRSRTSFSDLVDWSWNRRWEHFMAQNKQQAKTPWKSNIFSASSGCASLSVFSAQTLMGRRQPFGGTAIFCWKACFP